MKKIKYILGLGLLLLTDCENGEYNTNTNVLDI